MYANALTQLVQLANSLLLQLFKVFRALWANPTDDSFGENLTVDYFRRYIKDPTATSSVKYSGDFHDPQVC